MKSINNFGLIALLLVAFYAQAESDDFKRLNHLATNYSELYEVVYAIPMNIKAMREYVSLKRAEDLDLLDAYIENASTAESKIKLKRAQQELDDGYKKLLALNDSQLFSKLKKVLRKQHRLMSNGGVTFKDSILGVLGVGLLLIVDIPKFLLNIITLGSFQNNSPIKVIESPISRPPSPY